MTSLVPGLLTPDEVQQGFNALRNPLRIVPEPIDGIRTKAAMAEDEQVTPDFLSRSPLLMPLRLLEGSSIIAQQQFTAANWWSNLGYLTPEEGAVEHRQRVETAEEDLATTRERVSERDALAADQLARANLGQTVTPELAAKQKAALAKREQGLVGEKQKAVAKTKAEPDPTETWWRNVLESAVQSVGTTTVSTLQIAPILYELSRESITGVKGKSPVREWLDGVRGRIVSAVPGDKARADDFLTKLGSGGGSMTAFLAGGVAARAVGLSVRWGAGILGGAAQATQQIEDAEKYGTSTAGKWISLVAGAGLGATEAIPIDRMFGRLNKATGNRVADLLKTTTAGSLEEFTQELTQSVGQDVVAKYLPAYDPDRPWNFRNYLENATVGAIVGGLSATGIGTMGQGDGQQRAEDIKAQKHGVEVAAMGPKAVAAEMERIRLEEAAKAAETPQVRAETIAKAQDRIDEITKDVGAEQPAAEAAGEQKPVAAADVAAPAPATQIPGRYELVNPANILVDAKRFQFKEGANEQGVTAQLKGVETWDPAKAGLVLLWEDASGKRFVADGHQRVALAKRVAEASGKTSDMMSLVLKESEGISAEDARVIAATTNIAQGTGSAVDAAKVLRARPDMATGLPPQSALVRDAKGLQALSDEAFGAVVNDVVPAPYAAIVGRLASDKATHLPVLDVLAKNKPANAVEAESMVRDVLDAPQVQTTMADMFGSAEQTQILFKERAAVLSTAATMIRKDKAAFNTLVREQDRIAEAGNVLVSETNQQRAEQDAKLLASIQALARRKGPIADALAEAAKSLSEGQSRQNAARNFIDAIRGAVDPTVASDTGSGPGGQSVEENILFNKGQPGLFAVEPGAEGKPQTVIPGAEKISDAELVRRRAAQLLKPTVAQKPADFGLFGDEQNQLDLIDELRKQGIDLTVPRKGGVSLRGEPKRQPIADTGQDVEDVTLSSMKASLGKLLDLTVRQGFVRTREALGTYSRKTGVIRMKTWGDYSTLVHEAGHALHDDAGVDLDRLVRAHENELRNVASSLYGGDLTKASAEVWRREGFAEFFRVYMMNSPVAQSHAPQFFAAFETALKAKSPEAMEGLQLVREQFNAWLQIPSTRLVNSFIVSGRKFTMSEEARAGIKEDGMIGWAKRGFAKAGYEAYLAGIDAKQALRSAVFDLAEIAETNLGASFGLKKADNPYVLAIMGANSQNAAMVQLQNGIRGYRSPDVIGPALRDAIITAHGKVPAGGLAKFDEQTMADFNAYLVARRAVAEYARYGNGEIAKPPVPFNEADAHQAVADFETKYGDAFKNAAAVVHKVGEAMLVKSFDAGLISQEAFDLAMQKVDYVPLMRDMSDRKSVYGDSILTSGKASLLKRFRGSDRDIIAPLDSLMHRMFALEQTIARNEVKLALASLADKAGKGGGKWVERIPTTQIAATQVPVLETIRKVLDDPDLDPVDAANMAAVMEATFDEDAAVQIFRPKLIDEAGRRIVFFWENGERRALQIGETDVAGDLFNALGALGTENMPLLTDILTLPASMVRAGVTAWPDFLITNFIRDQVSAFFLSGTRYIPFVSGIKGVMNEVRNTQVAQDYNAYMGIMGGMNVASVNIARGRRDITALRGKGYIAEVLGDGTFLGAAKVISRLVELSETGSRLGIFEAGYKRAVKEGLSEHDAMVEAAFMATDYMNYGARGSRTLMWTRLVPFLNAALRGIDKTIRTGLGGEAAGRKGVRFALTAYFKNINNMDLSREEKMALKTGRDLWIKMTVMGLISATLAMAFKDDPDYQETSEYLRATGWVIPTGDGHVLWIPKPYELAVISNAMERAVEFANGDTKAGERFMNGVITTVVPPFQSPALRTAYELAYNIDTFRGGQLVPDYMRRLPPEMQYHARTSELAKRMGAAIGISPIKVEHTITSLFASAGRDLLPLLDAPLNPQRAGKGIDDTMIMRRFYRDPTRGSVSSRDFYEMASRFNGTFTHAASGYKRQLDTGNEAAANTYLAKLTPDERAWAVLNAHFTAAEKRMHPLYRAQKISTVISSMRREIVAARLADTGHEGEYIDMPASTKARVDDALSDIVRRELRNTLIVMKAPGWEGKKPLPLEPSMDVLRAADFDAAEELDRRLKKGKVYNAHDVYDTWPDLRQRLFDDGPDAELSDLRVRYRREGGG